MIVNYFKKISGGITHFSFRRYYPDQVNKGIFSARPTDTPKVVSKLENKNEKRNYLADFILPLSGWRKPFATLKSARISPMVMGEVTRTGILLASSEI